MGEPEVPLLNDYPIFTALPPQGLRYLQSSLIRREVTPNQVILPHGVRGDFLAIVAKGKVALKTPDGKEYHLQPGDAFGESMLRYGVPSPYEAVALKPTTLWLLPRLDFLRAQRLWAKAMERASAPLLRRWLFISLCLLLTLFLVGETLLEAAGLYLARSALAHGSSQPLTIAFSAALRLHPRSASLHNAYGYMLYQRGEYDRAEAEFQQAVALDSNLASARNNLGIVLLAKGQAPQAATHLQAVVQLDPGNAQAWENLGDAWLASGERTLAALAYLRASSLEPERLQARARWAALALEQGQTEEARRVWTEILELQPEDDEALFGLGMLHLLEKRPAEALGYLQAVQARNPTDALSRLLAGLALQVLGQPEKAAAEYEQVLALTRQPSLVTFARARLLELYPLLVPATPLSEEGG